MYLFTHLHAHILNSRGTQPIDCYNAVLCFGASPFHRNQGEEEPRLTE